ncbi:hypothetical protein SISNIDRAFT_476169 [Sistotremastrum niveocremeum HHB9708]|uniref:Citrate transporter-like domain-containing protein n=1 Tax=Sistotremastrum niveocremeum HHB9708 TaxID=1314777 RepID=A0A164NIQ0_9AGAM|nr:hypothetical protein SISNIDRAFT_476169 [Sistotremastrum niveocremeum HHB9708]
MPGIGAMVMMFAPGEPLRFIIGHKTAPVIAVLLLLVSTSIDGSVVRDGILGVDGVNPLDIMALFISLAYLAISLDATGLLRFLAFWVANRGGPSGRRLYILLYLFFLSAGILIGNDPVILSGTAFLVYFTKVSGIIPPTAWIFAQFSAANIASAVLVSSNPTNLVLSEVFSLSFASYTANLILPVLAAAAVSLPVVLYQFRNPAYIPSTIPSVTVDTKSILIDRPGAIIGSILTLCTLVTLVGTSPLKIPVWEVTVPPALIMLSRDILHDLKTAHYVRQSNANPTQGDFEIDNTEISPAGYHHRPPPSWVEHPLKWLSLIRQRFPTTVTILTRLPLSLLPFAFSMFILVQGLTNAGWTAIFAEWWAAWVKRTGTVGSIGGMAFLSSVLSNVCGTNIGTTVVLARTLRLWNELHAPSIRERNGAVYALALGTNFGAFTFSFSASLAGLLWRDILRQKGIEVTPWQFAKLNISLSVAAMLPATAVLLGQQYVIYK